MQPKKFYAFFARLLVTATILGACAPEAVATATEEAQEAPTAAPAATEEDMAMGPMLLPPVSALDVSGDVVVAGSSTVFPLAEAMIDRFQDEGYADQTTYDSIGSGGGFERFCVTGETDVAGASRAIRDSEIESCMTIGRNPIEFRVGTDALAVVVSMENDFVDNLTLEQLAAVFGSAETWADVDPSWPAEPIQRFIPGTDSGTFDYFVEEVYDEDETAILAASNTQLSEDDNVLVTGVQGSPYAIGFFGFAYYSENADTLKILSIEGVEANAANVDAGNYPLARPLFLYSDAYIMQSKPQVADFLNFFLTYVNEEIGEVGYFPAATAALEGAQQAWLEAMGAEAAAPDLAWDPLKAEGDIVIAGSSTVFPLAEAMIDRFQDEGYADQATYDSIGSGGGFERFCVNGETDISGASRPINDSEVESCGAIGRTPIEFRVGTDALAVVVPTENDFVTNLTLEQLALVFGEAETWADVDPSWPAEPIQRFIPGTDSGTFDYFVEEVYDEDETAILAASNTQLSEDDNVLVTGIQGSPYAIGFFGYAYYSENADTLKILSIDGVEANAANVDNSSYPLARPLFLYSDATIMQSKPQVAVFINFFLTFVNDEIGEVGYFPADPAVLEGALDAWAAAVGQ